MHVACSTLDQWSWPAPGLPREPPVCFGLSATALDIAPTAHLFQLHQLQQQDPMQNQSAPCVFSFPAFLCRTLQLQQRHDGPAQADNLKAKLTEAENKFMLADSEALTLREKTDLLEKQLKASELSFFECKSLCR